jgi:uncharacterized protein (DUF1697 family)
MPNYISLLRGINVSGHKKIVMADLKALYEELGFTNVQTYIQSGNVVFNSKETNTKELEQLLFNAMKAHYGFDVPHLILTAAEIEEALANNPFQDIEKMYFTFLSEIPTAENLALLKAFNFENEFYEINGKLIYSHYPNGAGKAKLNNNFFEKKLRISATTRNLRTTKKILEMAS